MVAHFALLLFACTSVAAAATRDRMDAATATTAGLTLRLYSNTAFAGAAAVTTVIPSLEKVATSSHALQGQPSSLLITGRLAPSTPGRFGFELSFTPALPYPSPDAYARLWIDDHLLYPLNETLAGWGAGIAPKWIPLPPRALDGQGRTIEAAASPPLGAYELRLEYVCMASHGCADSQTISLRWAQYSSVGDGKLPNHASREPFVPIPTALLVPAQSALELERRAMYTTLEQGWGTWDHTSSLSWALLPESFVVGAAFYRKSTGQLIGPAGLTVFSTGRTAAGDGIAFAGGFVLRLGLHSIDQSYTEAWLSWHGVNISIATTVDTGDRGKLTVVATVVGSSTKGSDVASDVAMLLIPRFTNGRAGRVSVSLSEKGIPAQLTGVGAGLRTTTVDIIQGSTFKLPATPVNKSVVLPAVYIGVDLAAGTPAVVVAAAAQNSSTRAGTRTGARAPTPGDVVAKTRAYRATEAGRLAKYGEWADVKDAVQTSLMWSVMYDPKLSLLAPSYAYSPGSEANPNARDGSLWAGQFEWDQSFAAYMLGMDALGLALSQIVALVKTKTAAGFVPEFSSGSFKTRTDSQPPVTAKALHEIAKRWGVNRTRWALELCLDDLYAWNTWMYTQRREVPLGLLSYGSSPYYAYAPDGTAASTHPSGGAPGSGLDNGPTVEGVPFNLTGLDLQDQYDAGFTGLYLMDTRAQIGIADTFGHMSC